MRRENIFLCSTNEFLSSSAEDSAERADLAENQLGKLRSKHRSSISATHSSPQVTKLVFVFDRRSNGFLARVERRPSKPFDASTLKFCCVPVYSLRFGIKTFLFLFAADRLEVVPLDVRPIRLGQRLRPMLKRLSVGDLSRGKF